MFRLPTIALITALSCATGYAQSDNQLSANSLMPGCRDLLAQKYTWEQAYCTGLLVGLARGDPRICRVPGVTHEQVVRVVVQYIDQRPARLNEDFMLLAAEVLRATWPCK